MNSALVRAADVLSISQRRLLNWQSTDGDCYRGTKRQLIAADLCKADWFPRRLEPQIRKNGSPRIGNNGRQRHRREYPVPGERTEIILRMVGHDRRGVQVWTAWFAVSGDKERARRKAKAEREELERREGEFARRQAEEHRILDKFDRERQEENAERARVLPSIIARLPELGEPTSAEVEHLRILRALSNDISSMLVDMTRGMLFKAKRGNELPALARLRLVINNNPARP